MQASCLKLNIILLSPVQYMSFLLPVLLYLSSTDAWSTHLIKEPCDTVASNKNLMLNCTVQSYSYMFTVLSDTVNMSNFKLV